MTRRPPAWVDGRKPDVAEEYESKLRQQIAAGRLHRRGVGHLPLDRVHATRELERAGRMAEGGFHDKDQLAREVRW